MATLTLAIWMNGERVGSWTQTRGSHMLQYDAAWAGAAAGRALSLSLPFTPDNAPHRGATVANYFDNLLPDSDTIRARIRSKFATATTSAFDLLSAIGRDCVGAVQLLPEGEPPAGFDRIDCEPLTETDVEQAIVASLSGARALGRENPDDFRISLAGAQEKTALLFHRGKWRRPLRATPTTHILKLPLGLVGNLQMDMRDSVENEWLCSRIMRAFGLDIAACEILRFGGQKVLAVERFDRARQPGGWIARLPQEDFCQAFGLPSAQKYEADGGPGMGRILQVLNSSSQAQADKRAFLKAQIVFWLLAAVDGHAKNFSIFHERDGTYRLTPFYDVLSAWPVIGRGKGKIDWHKAGMAMAVRGKNAHWKLKEIKKSHWDATARAAGLGDASGLLGEIAAQIPRVIQEVIRELPEKFPDELAGAIFSGMRRTAAEM